MSQSPAAPAEAGLEALRRPVESIDSLKLSILVISAVPILIVYLSLQRYFANGITLGGVKG